MRRSSFEERPGVVCATAIVTEALASLAELQSNQAIQTSPSTVGRKTGGETRRPMRPQIHTAWSRIVRQPLAGKPSFGSIFVLNSIHVITYSHYMAFPTRRKHSQGEIRDSRS